MDYTVSKPMGFHKRHINLEQILSTYNNRGLEGVRQLFFRRVDALVLEDLESAELWELLTHRETTVITEYLEKLYEKQFGSNIPEP